MPILQKLRSHIYNKRTLYSIFLLILFTPIACIRYFVHIYVDDGGYEVKKDFAHALAQEGLKDVPAPILIAEIIKSEWNAICILTAYSDRFEGSHLAIAAANHALEANKSYFAGEGEFVIVLLMSDDKSKVLKIYNSAEVNNPGDLRAAPRDLLERFKTSSCAFRNNAYAIPYLNRVGKINFYLSEVE